MTPWPQFSPQFSPQFTSADFASGRATSALTELWQQAKHGTFDSVSKRNRHSTANIGVAVSATSTQLQLHYSYWQPESARAALVLIPGRIEAGHKYLEFINEALAAGFQVYVLDHQGQGASARLDGRSQVGDVRLFNDYVTDLDSFIHQIVKQLTTLPLLALAHSMGGGILCRYLQQQLKHGLTAAIFCSPMWGIPTRPLPQALALPLSRSISRLNQLFSQQSWYVTGQGPYQNRPFTNNDLSHCQERYQWFRALYQQCPAYQLGGISWRWLAEALAACQQMQHGPIPQLPCLLLQAGADQVVDNRAQTMLWRRFAASPGWLQASKQYSIPAARHELLFETDTIRQLALTLINQFLAQLNATTAE